MGGSNDDSNIVTLTAREHYIAHWLLWKIHRNRQTALAFAAMCNFKSCTHGKNRITSSRMFEAAREAMSMSVKQMNRERKGNQKYCRTGNANFIDFHRDDINFILEQYKNGETLTKIGSLFEFRHIGKKLSKNAISRVLKDEKIKLRTPSENATARNLRMTSETKKKMSESKKGSKNFMYKKSLKDVWEKNLNAEDVKLKINDYREKMSRSIKNAHEHSIMGWKSYNAKKNA
jgi:hypothetical protein